MSINKQNTKYTQKYTVVMQMTGKNRPITT